MVAGGGTDAGAAPEATVPIAGSYLRAPNATDLGPYAASAMGVEVVLAPSDGSVMTQELAALYDPSSPSYHKWLTRGAFAGRFASSASVRGSVVDYLRQQGLKVVASASPFLVRAVGTSARVAGAFGTTIDNYGAAKSHCGCWSRSSPTS